MATAHATSQGPKYAQSIRAGNHVVIADESASLGGADAGMAPYPLLLSALAACTSITLRMYADRKGWELGEVHTDVTFVRDDAGDERIDRVISVSDAVTAEQKARLAEIADKTPVTKTLRRGTPIATRIA